MNSQSNGDIIIEYNTRREAEIAKSNGAVYENTPIHIDWYGNSNIQGGGMNDQNNNGGSDVMMTE